MLNIKLLKKTYQIAIEKSRKNFFFFCENFIKITDRDSGEIVPLILNYAQKEFVRAIRMQYLKQGNNDIVGCKSRKMGLSTVTIANALWMASTGNISINYYLLAQQAGTGHEIFNTLVVPMVKSVCNYLGGKILKANTEETQCIINDKIHTFTYGTAGVGGLQQSRGGARGVPNVNYLHLTECAFYAKQDIISTYNAVNKKNGIKIGETTLAGIGNYAYQKYRDSQRQNSRTAFFFCAWPSDPGYKLTPPDNWNPISFTIDYNKKYGPLTNDQMYWLEEEFYTHGEDEKLLHSEFPPNLETGFAQGFIDSLVDLNYIEKAFIPQNIEIVNRIVTIGIDVGLTNDATVICINKNNRIFEFEKVFIDPKNYRQSFFAVTAKVEEICIKLQSEKYFIDHIAIDETGLGQGLYQIIYQKFNPYGMRSIATVRNVNFAAKATHIGHSRNNRNYGIKKIKQTFESELPIFIPTSSIRSELTNEILATKISYETGELSAISKQKIKQSLGKSPDYLDAMLVSLFFEQSIVNSFAIKKQFIENYRKEDSSKDEMYYDPWG